MKLTNHIDGGKAAQLVNMLLHLIANSSDASTIMSAEGQIGYNQQTQKAQLKLVSAIVSLLTNADIYSGDMRDQAAAPAGRVAEAKATADGLKSLENYLLNIIASQNTVVVGFSAEEETQFPSNSTLNTRYRVISPGTVQGITLANGDLFFPNITNASPTNSAHWTFVQANVDQASDTVFGLVRLMPALDTLQEILTASPSTLAVTKDTLASYHQAFSNFLQDRIYTSTVNLVTGANTITHNLGNTNLQVQAKAASGEVLLFDWTIGAGTTHNQVNTIVINSLLSLTNVQIRIQADYMIFLP